jgi:hypothetical protein
MKESVKSQNKGLTIAVIVLGVVAVAAVVSSVNAYFRFRPMPMQFARRFRLNRQLSWTCSAGLTTSIDRCLNRASKVDDEDFDRR